MIEVKIVWVFYENPNEKEEELAELLNKGWRIAAAGGGPPGGAEAGDVVGFVILQRDPVMMS